MFVGLVAPPYLEIFPAVVLPTTTSPLIIFLQEESFSPSEWVKGGLSVEVHVSSHFGEQLGELTVGILPGSDFWSQS